MVGSASARPPTHDWMDPAGFSFPFKNSKKRVLASHLGKIALLSRDDLDVGYELDDQHPED